MTVNLDSGAQRLATFAQPKWIHFRVLHGHIHFGQSQQEVTTPDGLSAYPSDGLISINWERGELWVSGSGDGSKIEILLP